MLLSIVEDLSGMLKLIIHFDKILSSNQSYLKILYTTKIHHFFKFFEYVIFYYYNPFCQQEARALLGRYEYQKGNTEAALHVFEGLDIGAVTAKMKVSLTKRGEHRRRSSRNYDAPPPMSLPAVGLLLEAVLLKAKCLQALGRFKGTFSCSICGFPLCFF